MVSIIIRYKNEEQWIGHAIQSAIDHVSNPEFIMINDKSSDESSDIIRMFEKWCNIKSIKIDNYSPGRALNLGVLESSNKIIMVLSAHCVLKQFDISKYNFDNYVAVFGKQIPVYRGRRINIRYIWEHFVDDTVVDMFSKIEKRYFLHNALCLYNRDFLIENKFDENLYGKEDRYWATNIINKGYHYLYDPALSCYHHWTPNGATWKGIG